MSYWQINFRFSSHGTRHYANWNSFAAR